MRHAGCLALLLTLLGCAAAPGTQPAPHRLPTFAHFARLYPPPQNVLGDHEREEMRSLISGMDTYIAECDSAPWSFEDRDATKQFLVQRRAEYVAKLQETKKRSDLANPSPRNVPSTEASPVRRPALCGTIRVTISASTRLSAISCSRLAFSSDGELSEASLRGDGARLESSSILVMAFLRNDGTLPAWTPRVALVDDLGRLYAPARVVSASDDLAGRIALNPGCSTLGCAVFPAPFDAARGYALVAWPDAGTPPISMPLNEAQAEHALLLDFSKEELDFWSAEARARMQLVVDRLDWSLRELRRLGHGRE